MSEEDDDDSRWPSKNGILSIAVIVTLGVIVMLASAYLANYW